ncbi:MAG: hypothetical protein LVR00_01410 [Rhabdochlamydiaceae bacterium]|jgi:hypothetical protein
MVSYIVSRVAGSAAHNIGETLSSSFSSRNSAQTRLERSFELAIAETNRDNVRAIRDCLEANLEHLALTDEDITDLRRRLGEIDSPLLLDYTSEYRLKIVRALRVFSDKLPASFLATKAQEAAKTFFYNRSRTYLESLSETLPPKVYSDAFQSLSAYRVDEHKTAKSTAQEILKIFKDTGFYAQGIDVFGLIQQMAQAFDPDENKPGLPSSILEAQLRGELQQETEPHEEFFDAVSGEEMGRVKNSEELKKLTLDEKERLIQNTSMLLRLNLACGLCLSPAELSSMEDGACLRLLDQAKKQTETTPDVFLRNYVMGSIRGEGILRNYRVARATVIWWFLSLTIPFVITNLLNYIFNAFYKEYISSDPRKLFAHIIANTTRFLTILDGNYERVRTNPLKNDDLDGMLAQEYENRCNYRAMTRVELYTAVLRHVLQVALGGSLLARITSVTLINRLFGWAVVPRIVAFIDRSVTSFLRSGDGYPHAVNSIFSKQLENLKANLQAPDSSKRRVQAALVSTNEKRSLKECIENLLRVLHRNGAASSNSFDPPGDAIRLFYTVAATSIAPVLAALIQDLYKDGQMEMVFFDLLQKMNQAYDEPSLRPSKAEANALDQRVKSLTQEVTALSVGQFVEELDLCGENQQQLFMSLLRCTRERILKVSEETRQILPNLKFNQDQLANLEKRVTTIEENITTLNDYIRNLSSFSLMAQHKAKLEDTNRCIILLQQAFQKHLDEMKKVIAATRTTKDLHDIQQTLVDLENGLNRNDTNVQVDFPEWPALKSILNGYDIALGSDTARLQNAAGVFESNRMEQQTLEGLLQSLTLQNYQRALRFLGQQAGARTWWGRRNDADWRKLAATPVQDNPRELSILERTRAVFMAPPVTLAAQNAVIESIRSRLQAQSNTRADALNGAKRTLCAFIYKTREEINRKQEKVAIQDPVAVFAKSIGHIESLLDRLDEHAGSHLGILQHIILN